MGPDAPAELEAIFAELGLAANVCAPADGELHNCLARAIDNGPDLLVVLAGDGTARAAAELCGPEGPLIAPLPGGTMNMLPHAVYGARPWQEVLRDALANGREQVLGGGRVEGHRFLCGAILGSPARLASAREAARQGKGRLALAHTRRALRRAFTGRLRYSLDGGDREKAEALILMCPIASRALASDAQSLEAAAVDVHGAGEILRLGFNAVVGDWRNDPAVEAQPCEIARVWSARAIPALLDGEAVTLDGLIEVTFEPAICRVLATPPKEGLA